MTNARTPNRDRAEQLLARMKHLNFVLDKVNRLKAHAPIDGATLSLAHQLLPDDVIEAAIWACAAPAGKIRTDSETGKPFWNPDELLERLQDAVLDALRAGMMKATAFDSRNPIDADAVLIPADRWHSLNPDWDGNRIQCDGFVLTGIKVALPPAPTASAKAIITAKRGRKTPYLEPLRTMLKRLQGEKPDVYGRSADNIRKEVERLWKQQGRNEKLPARSALNSAIDKFRREYG